MALLPSETIRIKRNKGELTPDQIKEFVNGYVEGIVADYQMSAFLMATFFRGMSKKETWALTEAMLHSGIVLDLSSIPGFKIDKHSTGGVGDKTSLIIGPMAAAAGVKVPMISGRGLGHTGGTLDKLESIPGFSTQLLVEEFKAKVEKHGLCFIGQTKEICPADKRMYALRDVTATVECVPLISASIMSKKLAEGIDGLVLDVKVGSGAFMKSLKEAKVLAKTLVAIAQSSKKKVVALLTDMNQPLGFAIGNSLEIEECIDVLKDSGPRDLRELSIELAAHMIHLGNAAKTFTQARTKAEATLRDGSALQKFEEMVRAQGGRFPLLKAEKTFNVLAPKKGFLHKVETEKVGIASLLLGAGRKKAEDQVDPSAGMLFHKKIGDAISKGEVMATLHYNGEKPIQDIQKLLLDSIEIRLQKVRAPRLILGRMGHT